MTDFYILLRDYVVIEQLWWLAGFLIAVSVAGIFYAKWEEQDEHTHL